MRSKFKIGSILLILILNFINGGLILLLLTKAKISPFTSEFWRDNDFKIAVAYLLVMEFMVLCLLSNVRLINIKNDRLIFRHLLLPFIKKEKLFTYYDY
jgi:hypothetical protein